MKNTINYYKANISAALFLYKNFWCDTNCCYIIKDSHIFLINAFKRIVLLIQIPINVPLEGLL